MNPRREKDQKEQSLIQRCKGGEFRAFRELVEQYQSRIYAVCFGIVRNREDTFDVMQEVFIKIYNSIKHFSGQSGLYVWIYRIAVNTGLDFFRKRKRKQKIIEKSYQDGGTVKGGSHSQSPADIAVSLELKDLVHRAIAKLPDNHKSIIVLREIEGLSYQEIAKIMECSEGTVMSRLFYARKTLMTLLKKYMAVNGDRQNETT
ncbi:MAG: sigma-70 family RNA polymerase sigma factor [Candidatus Omnitrophota bacterium]